LREVDAMSTPIKVGDLVLNKSSAEESFSASMGVRPDAQKVH